MRLSIEKAFRTLRAGHTVWQVWGHAHQNRFTTPHTERLEVYVRSQALKGKRLHQRYGRVHNQFGHLLNGSLADAYFTSRRQAEKFAQEIRDGLHPSILWDMRDREEAFDLVDEELGICDRGLGVYEDPMDMYQYDELEFA